MAKLDYPSWVKLSRHAEKARQFSIRQLFSDDASRATEFTIEAAGLYLDYSKNLLDRHSLQLFSDLSVEANLKGAIEKMFRGATVNLTEQRAALHTLVRASSMDTDESLPLAPGALSQKRQDIAASKRRMKRISDAIRAETWLGFSGQPIRHIVHLGIGGSYLGPHMVDEALTAFENQDITCHYIANVDGQHITHLLAQLDVGETLVIIASKSFTTLETMTNAKTARKWLLTNMGEGELSKHLVAITANTAAAVQFGIAEDNLLPIWDWIGGRYSLWSAVSLPVAIRYGFDLYERLLQGASAMDQHFLNADAPHNMPVMLAWISIFYQHFFGAQSHAVLPYDHFLRLLPDHLQQLDMESNGKSVRVDGNLAEYPTGAISWGGEGTNGQHAFHQLLHQGTRFVGIDFILPLRPHHNLTEHHDRLVASCLSQSQALMLGRAENEISPSDPAIGNLHNLHKVTPGNRPSNTIVLDQVTPESLGALIALYEHKIYCQAVIWKINPFDQWGVELGKELGDAIYSSIQTDGRSRDASTETIIKRYQQAKSK